MKPDLDKLQDDATIVGSAIAMLVVLFRKLIRRRPSQLTNEDIIAKLNVDHKCVENLLKEQDRKAEFNFQNLKREVQLLLDDVKENVRTFRKEMHERLLSLESKRR